ncbi:hypothetical protein ACWDYJ_10100 [Streptomyces sp. NPDC003042]
MGMAGTTPTASPYLLALGALTYLLGVRSAATKPVLLLFGACMTVDLALCAVLRVGAVYWFYAVSMLPLALVVPWLAGRYRQARLAWSVTAGSGRGAWSSDSASSPNRQFRYVPDIMRAQPAPPGTVCEFYRSNTNLLDQVDVYRLCYTDSRLMTKDVLRDGVPPDTRSGGTPPVRERPAYGSLAKGDRNARAPGVSRRYETLVA